MIGLQCLENKQGETKMAFGALESFKVCHDSIWFQLVHSQDFLILWKGDLFYMLFLY